MNLEILPNEILLHLFQYFNSIDLLHIFYGLNSRFNFLLYKEVRFYRVKFTFVSKRHFDMICQQHLPFIANRIIALDLSDHRDTPQQIVLFLSYIPSFSRFTQLRSLTLFDLHSYESLLKLLGECCHLNNLTHLDIHSCSLSIDQVNFQLIVDNIWSLPKLINCSLYIKFQKYHLLYLPTIISLSLESITMYYGQLKMNQINQLFKYTPRLKHLQTIGTSINDDYMPSPLTILIDLNIYFSDCSDYSKMIVFLQNILNLRCLDINIPSELIDGHQWEYIIRIYLPKLKTFRLKMCKRLPFDNIIQESIDRLIDSFRNIFWINECQWYVRCFAYNRRIHLHTVSQLISWFPATCLDLWRSTYPHDNHEIFHNNIDGIYDETFFNIPIPSHIRLSNIEHLHIKFPINDQFWSIVPSLKHLYSLTISSYADTFQFQLQDLFNRAPYLYALTIRQDVSLSLQMSLFTCTNICICHLDLRDYNHYFNEEESITLSHLSLTTQCEVLSIRVHNRESIIILVTNLIHLRILHICWNDENNSEQFQLTENNGKCSGKRTQILDELVQWLKDRLPSTYLINNDPYYDHDISIWI
ncbi:unnamed protein product [Rotaria sp. Silwood2]|nr:unnamed protein product [Rotaria sp. Silwood2]